MKSLQPRIQPRRFALLSATSTLFLSGIAAALATGGPSSTGVARGGKVEGNKVRFTDAKGRKRKWVCVTVNGVLAARCGVATPAHTVTEAEYSPPTGAPRGEYTEAR